MTQTRDPRLDKAALAHRQGRLDEARTLYEAILASQPDHPVVLHNLGVLVLQGGDPKGAVAHLRRLCTVAPRHPRHWQALAQAMAAAGQGGKLKALAAEAARHGVRLAPPEGGGGPKPPGGPGQTPPGRDLNGWLRHIGALGEQGLYEAALAECQAFISHAPQLPQGYNFKGLALSSLGRVEEAIETLKVAVSLKPPIPDAFRNLGNCYRKQGDDLAALTAYDKALELRPDYVQAWNNRGNALAELGRAEEAEAAYREALRLDPDYAEALNGLANLMHALGRLKEGEALARQAVAVGRKVAVYASHLAGMKTFTEPDDPDIALLEDMLERSDLPIEEQGRVAYALGKARHDLADAGRGSHTAAFEMYARGAALIRSNLAYDVEYELHGLRQLAQAIPRVDPPVDPDPSVRPIYIVGMPRSGTSLTEQIIASHPLVHGAGEMQMVPNLVKAHSRAVGLDTPWDWARQLTPEQGAEFSRELLERLQALVPAGATRVTDKAPLNFLFAGILSRVVPGVRIVHIHRDPMDVALSCFQRFFVNSGQPYSYDLTELGRFMAGYQRLVAHWQEVLSPEVYIDLPYDDLVADPESTIRELIDRLGLPWDDACLSHHTTKRVVRTPSSSQVRQPVHGGRRGRWRAFEKELEPVRQALESDG